MSIQNDLKSFLRERGVTRKQFASLVGVNPCALSRFLCNPGCSIAERIVPYLYGDKRDEVHPDYEQGEESSSEYEIPNK